MPTLAQDALFNLKSNSAVNDESSFAQRSFEIVWMNVPLHSFISACSLHLFEGVAVIVEHHLVRLKWKSLRVQDQDMLRKEIYELPKLPLVLPELLLNTLALLDIRHQVVPTDNATLGIALWTTSHLDPTVHAIGS